MTEQFKRNRLDEATSPYLLQHKDNPVHWQPWEPQVFDEARRRNVPVLLSIGYAACHWCHVMAHESFEDDEVAALMNAHFVCIKLDREERPDLDDIYMNALHMMGEQGGWPLTICLDADAKPFWGGTYFPKTPQYGRPGFMQILAEISRIWTEAPDKIAKNTLSLSQALATQAQADARGHMDEGLPARAAQALTQHIDRAKGGLAGAPKFPQAFLYQFLWRHAQATGDADMRAAIIVTLEKICQGGIYDHLGGGFARYSVDADWLVPHFEKMLYDNALLIELMTLVWRDTRSPLLAQRIEETIDWLARDMVLANGAFAASLDADTQGEEGRYYVWTQDEIDAALGDDAAAFAAAYDITQEGNFEGKNIPHLLAHGDALFAALAAPRARLLALRATREAPGRDDKILADWNGMMIAALADAACVFDRPDWLAMAQRAFDAARNALSDEAGRLCHSARDGRRLAVSLAADYGFFGQAAAALYRALGETVYLDYAVFCAAQLEADFRDTQLGGYRARPHAQAEDGLVNARPHQDNAAPSANAAIHRLLSELALLTGQPDYAAQAQEQFAGLSGHLAKGFSGMTALLDSHQAGLAPLSLILIQPAHLDDDTGKDKNSDTALLRAAQTHPIATRTLVVLSDTDTLPAAHPAAGKTALEGRPTAYICPGQSCLAPISTPEELTAQLDGLMQARHISS